MKKILTFVLLAVVAMQASAYVGETFEVGYLTYKVISEPPSKPAEVAVTGLNATGKATSNLVLNFRSTIGHGDYTYTVTEVAELAFENQKNIVSVEFNSGMRTIVRYAFYKCSNLSKITFNSNSVVNIFDYAFFGAAITSLHLPASLEEFAGGCVNNCNNLTSITVDEANPKFSSLNGLLYDKKKTKLYRCPPGIEGNMLEKDFPDSLTTIGFNAFGYSKLKKLYLPYGITSIYAEAFNATYFDELKIPSSVTEFPKDAFYLCAARDLYIAHREAPQLRSDEFWGVVYFGNLHVPSGAKFRYENAPVWSKFTNVYEDAFDFNGYALFSSKDAQGKDIYFGECRFCVLVEKKYGTPAVTLSHISNVNLPGTLTIRDYITDPRTGEKFIVSKIGSDVCRDGMNADFELVMGKNVKEVEDHAFKDITQLKKVTFSPALKYIRSSAFENCRIANDVILPYGLISIGEKSLYNNSFKRILLPSTLDRPVPGFMAKNNNLEEIIVNNPKMKEYNGGSNPIDLTNIPSSCKVYVPVGCVDMFKNSEWGKFNVMEGAFDFVTGSNITGNRYKMTVTSSEPVTVDGVTYDGTAKYVYHPDVLLGSGAYVATDVETNTFNGKKYLMTEFGDSVLCGATGITSVTTSRMKHLERIGNYAFKGSGIKEFTIPSSIKNIGLKAFVSCKNLSELFITQPTNNYSWAGHFYGDNASDFTCYVKWTSLPDLQKSVTNWTRYNNVNPLDQLNGYVQLSTDNKAAAIAVNHPVDWAASGLNAYVVSKYDPATQTVTTGTAGKSSANKGVLVTDYVKDQIYKLQRPTGTVYNKTNLLVGAADAAVNVYQQPGGFLFDGAKKYFWKPTSTYNLTRGYAYLKLDEATAGSTSRVYVDLWPNTPDFKTGDVDGSGEVDITDANILINIILGKDKASNYNGRADVDGNGVVDITDVNTVLNIILGK